MRYVRIILVSAALTLPIALLARAPYDPPHNDVASLRFSWRTSIKAREHCRPRKQEELDELPVHMRTPEVCTRDDAGYTLVIRIDNLPTDTVSLVRGGVKGDRPLFVHEQRTLSAGPHRVRAALARVTASGTERLAAIDTTLVLYEGAVGLITLEDGSRRLTARSGSRCRTELSHRARDERRRRPRSCR